MIRFVELHAFQEDTLQQWNKFKELQNSPSSVTSHLIERQNGGETKANCLRYSASDCSDMLLFLVAARRDEIHPMHGNFDVTAQSCRRILGRFLLQCSPVEHALTLLLTVNENMVCHAAAVRGHILLTAIVWGPGARMQVTRLNNASQGRESRVRSRLRLRLHRCICL